MDAASRQVLDNRLGPRTFRPSNDIVIKDDLSKTPILSHIDKVLDLETVKKRYFRIKNKRINDC